MLRRFLVIAVIFSGKLFAQPACVPAVSFTASQNNICLGTAVTFKATVTNGGTNAVYKWKKNNGDVGGNNANYVAADLRDGDVVICAYSCKTACGVDTTVMSKAITMNVLNDVTPVITIANNDSLICEHELTLFTSEAYYGNEVPFYQWMVNGKPVGGNTPDYTTDSITNGARIECTLTVSTPSCPGTSKSANSQLTIYVYPLIKPDITITASDTTICRGESVDFTALANGGVAPTFVWTTNGKPNGSVAPDFSSSTLKDGDTISCTITIDQDSRCKSGVSGTSNKVVVHVKDFVDPTVQIASADLDVCAGTTVTFTTTYQNAGDYEFYRWAINGRDVFINSPTFNYNKFADGDKVSCRMTTNIPGCFYPIEARSNEEQVRVREAPAITFSPPEISVLSGESAQINAAVSGSVSSFTWRPASALVNPQSLTPATIPLAQDTSFNLAVVDINGCTASDDVAVKVLHKLYMPSAFTPNKDGKNDVFRIPPGSSLNLKEFSVFDRWGNVIFKTKDIAEGWNGTFKGQDLVSGTYVYLIKGTFREEDLTVKGTVILIR
jgi:gliding motility-associated-like protein